MALKRYQNGTFEITSKKQAIEAYELIEALNESIRELEKEHGITEMRQDAVGLKQSADAFMVTKSKNDLEIESIGKVAKVIRGADGMWVETKEDLREIGSESGARSLRSIVGSEIWKRITKRRLDPDKLAEAIATGEVDEDEIQQAYVEKPRKPYVRLYDI